MNHYTKKLRPVLGNGGLYTSILFTALMTAVLPVNGQEEAPQPNYIENTVFDVDGNGNNVSTRTFSDGQGLKLQTQTLINGTNKVLVSGTGYNGFDAAGRPLKTVKPFAQPNGSQLTFISDDLYKLANSYYQIAPNQYDSAYSSVQYSDDPLGRIKAFGAPGVNFTATISPVKSWYFGTGDDLSSDFFSQDGFLVVTLFDKAQKTILGEDVIKTYLEFVASDNPDRIKYNLTITVDQNGNFTQEITDATGKTIRTWSMANGVQGEIISKMTYDVLGRLTEEQPPSTGITMAEKVRPTTYTYNSFSQVDSKTTPDAGTVYNYYDNVGRIKEVIDANCAGGNSPVPNLSPRLHYEYDKLGRNTTISRYEPANKLFCTWTRNIYDFPGDAKNYLASSEFPWDQLDDILTGPINGLTNTKGRVVATIAYDQGLYAQRAVESEIQGYESSYSGKVIDLFSYDDEGRVIRKYKSIPGIALQMIKYGYDFQGKIKADTIEFKDKDNETIQIRTAYDYDNRGQLWKISRNDKEFVRYDYDETGRMQSKTFLYGTDKERKVNYTYNIRNWTKSIKTCNKDNTSDNTFSEELCYETNDLGDVTGFTFEPQYNGNISRAGSHTDAKDNNNKTIDGADLDLFYSYDGVNRLCMVKNNESYAGHADYDATFNYFNDGRILNKNEKDQQGWGNYIYYKDKDTVNYTNKLKSILASGKGDNTISNYVYDYNGNMVLDRSKKMAVEYDWRNMPTSFSFFSSVGNDITTCEQVKVFCANTAPVSKVCMLYDAYGNRVKKENVTVTVSSEGLSDLLITNAPEKNNYSVTQNGAILSNRVFADMSVPIPNGALIMENLSGQYKGQKTALSENGFQMQGKLSEGGLPSVENSDMDVEYTTRDGGSQSENPQLAVNNQGKGVVISGWITPDMTVTTGVGYADNSVFEKAAPQERQPPTKYALSYVNTAEGVSRPNNDFEFYIRDHLGSTRAVMNEGSAGNSWQMQEAMAYLAYGAVQSLKKAPVDNNARQKFTGKELDEDGRIEDEHGGVICAGMMLDYFDARYYDPEIGAWTSTDPYDEFWNAYSYGPNNSINGIDPNGGAWILSTNLGFKANVLPFAYIGLFTNDRVLLSWRHDQIFFDEPQEINGKKYKSIGYFADVTQKGNVVFGIPSTFEDQSNNASYYSDFLKKGWLPDNVALQAIENVLPQYENSTYLLFQNNCQTFAADVWNWASWWNNTATTSLGPETGDFWDNGEYNTGSRYDYGIDK